MFAIITDGMHWNNYLFRQQRETEKGVVVLKIQCITL